MVWFESDAEIIRSSIAEPAAFGAIFDRHFVGVHGYLSRRVGRAGSDELAGEVFSIAFESRVRFDPSSASARPWLFGIATHLVARWYRSAARRHRAYERLVGLAATTGNEYAVADERLDASAVRRVLGSAIDALTDGDRDVLLLYAWEGMSYDEIAAALAIPVGTVRSRLHRARRIVRELLEPNGQLTVTPESKGRDDG